MIPSGALAKGRRIAPTLVAWGVGVVIFFRRSWLTGFDKLSGNPGDARLVAVLNEHDRLSLAGRETWLSPDYFHPHQGSLGYSDTVALMQMVYLPFRSLGADLFLASQLAWIATTLVSFLGVYLLVRQAFGCDRPIATVAAWLATFPNNLYLAQGHPQLFVLAWVPWVGVLVAVAARSTGWRRRGLGALAGCLVSLIAYSSFYVGWMSVLTVSCAVVLFILVRVDRLRWRRIASGVTDRADLVVAVALGAVLVAPLFLVTYLDAARQTGGRSFDEVLSFAPIPSDLVNVGRTNLSWGRVLDALFGTLGIARDRLLAGETRVAVTPLLAGFSVVCLLVVLVRRRSDEVDERRLFGAALVLAAWMLVLASVRIGRRSLWQVVLFLVPGASAIRDGARMAIVANMLIVVGVAAIVRNRQMLTRASGRIAALAPVALAALLLVEQVNRADMGGFDRSDSLAVMHAARNRPGECEVFFIVSTAIRNPTELNVDAMTIAIETNTSTVNGYSGIAPPGWSLDPIAETYVADVQTWLARFDIADGVCSYDRDRGVWTPDPFVQPAAMAAP